MVSTIDKTKIITASLLYEISKNNVSLAYHFLVAWVCFFYYFFCISQLHPTWRHFLTFRVIVSYILMSRMKRGSYSRGIILNINSFFTMRLTNLSHNLIIVYIILTQLK